MDDVITPVTAVVFEGTKYLMVQDPFHKGGLMPMTPSEQEKYLSQNIVAFGPIYLNGSKERDQVFHALSRPKDACQALCKCGRLLKDNAAAWKLLLLAMLARVLDCFQAEPESTGKSSNALLVTAQDYVQLYQMRSAKRQRTKLPDPPVVILEDVQTVPPTAELLLRVVNGEPKRNAKRWQLKRPNVLSPIRPIGVPVPSEDPYRYMGGKLEINSEEKTVWLPLRNMAVAIEPNCPTKIKDLVADTWPDCIPVLCGKSMAAKSRTLISLNGEAFWEYDPQVGSELEDYARTICAELCLFMEEFRSWSGYWSNCMQQLEQYIPRRKQGRYVCENRSSEVLIWAHALALFRAFLDYACNEKEWLSENEAETTFQEVWRLVLPESVPDKSDENTVITGPTAESFWIFLCSYLKENRDHMAGISMPRTEDTVGVLHDLNGECYLILPRMKTFEAYCKKIPGIYKNGIRWDAKIQKMLFHLGVPFKKEKRDTTWRFDFYKGSHIPEEDKDDLPCLGLPVNGLPENVLNCVNEVFGTRFGKAEKGDPARSEPEQ